LKSEELKNFKTRPHVLERNGQSKEEIVTYTSFELSKRRAGTVMVKNRKIPL